MLHLASEQQMLQKQYLLLKITDNINVRNICNETRSDNSCCHMQGGLTMHQCKINSTFNVSGWLDLEINKSRNHLGWGHAWICRLLIQLRVVYTQQNEKSAPRNFCKKTAKYNQTEKYACIISLNKNSTRCTVTVKWITTVLLIWTWSLNGLIAIKKTNI